MRRLRASDGTPTHRKGARYHLGRLSRGGAQIHADLKSEMEAHYAALKAAARATDDAEDNATEAAALADAAEIEFENAIRDVDAALAKLDRDKPDLNARATVFPDGFGSEIDPDGEAQLAALPALRKRIEGFASHAGVNAALTHFNLTVTAFAGALEAENTASIKVDEAFQSEQDARRHIREQLESAHGRLRDFYKSRPALAEAFFLKEGGRKPAKNPTPEAAPTPPT